ncbi:reverse transcriptase domain-containing protein [Tanacetum coccineum]
MSIQLADRSIKYPIRFCENLLVKISKSIFPVDFVVLEMDEDELVPIILGQPFLATARAVIDVHEGKLSLRVGSETVTFNIGKSISKYSRDDYLYCADHTAMLVQEQSIDTVNHVGKWTVEEEEYSNEVLAVSFYPRTEPDNNQLLMVISSALSTVEKVRLLEFKLSVKPQRRVNPNIKEVVKKEVVKLLDAGLIYPISDSPWVSPVQVFPKKGGMTVLKNEKDELIPQQTVTGWCVCIDYRKLNNATRKDHFPLLFIDQMLERLAGHEYCCFLDRFSGYFQIPIAPEDQEKTTFTCPYGTFAYKRMPFGLCNAPTTFQRCMTAIFHELIEDNMEAPIMIKPDWSLPFEIMCDASDYAVGAVLGQSTDKHFKPIHYANKTMNKAQENYTSDTKLGTPLMLDSYTSDMCMQSWGRSSYARVIIELRADVALKDNIVVAMPKITKEGHYTCNVHVEYEWKPPRCSSCKVFGHIHEECPKNTGVGEKKTD